MTTWCLVPGCTNDTASPYTLHRGMLCHSHWRKLPMEVRKEFWLETDFGKNQPSEELRKRIIEQLEAK